MKWVNSTGIEVEPILLDDRPVLDVRDHGHHIAYCPSVAELGRYVDLADLRRVP